MKSLAQVMCILSLVLLSATAVAGGSEVVGGRPRPPQDGMSPARIVPVSGVAIQVYRGCGQPNPNGCPDDTEVNFTVAIGGPCHTYSVNAQSLADHTVLTILDSFMANCTRPEQQNHEASVNIAGNLGNKPVVIGNPIYIKTMYRP
jgi:hypothetical protein